MSSTASWDSWTHSASREHPPVWNLPLPPDALAYARAVIPDARPTLLVSPCSSHALRNWRAGRLRARGRSRRAPLGHAGDTVRRTRAPSSAAWATKYCRTPPLNPSIRSAATRCRRCSRLLGAATVLLSPDSGPAHMAAMVGTPVIGLYAPTNPARSGPYFSRQWCVDRFPRRRASSFGPRARGVAVECDQDRKTRRHGLDSAAAVIDKLDRFMAGGASRRSRRNLPLRRSLRPLRILEGQSVRLAAHAHDHGNRQNEVDARGAPRPSCEPPPSPRPWRARCLRSSSDSAR